MDKRNYVIAIIVIGIIRGIVIFGEPKYQVVIDGKDIECEMIVEDGVTYLAVRDFSKELGIGVHFEDDIISIDTSTLSNNQEDKNQRYIEDKN